MLDHGTSHITHAWYWGWSSRGWTCTLGQGRLVMHGTKVEHQGGILSSCGVEANVNLVHLQSIYVIPSAGLTALFSSISQI